ncbi:MAG: hypothetical protein AVDCRST_MAG30-1021 [uncultured Solirubrobacteraceae bacterium]|uniref:Uncharacterized protein n=1 Tax=uncultured Solirubrobacteraceae bacterium TaxID=1162706 RepID=A0A6J4S7M9_9ACTN|nr:MAG: hypothetical protein AVDCRST_MAG30-1021 [uncultured Solirubrobacteraceae bacterium]
MVAPTTAGHGHLTGVRITVTSRVAALAQRLRG